MGDFDQLETGTVRCIREKPLNTARTGQLELCAFWRVVLNFGSLPFSVLFSPVAGNASRWLAVIDYSRREQKAIHFSVDISP
jgi:hypothetical protein